MTLTGVRLNLSCFFYLLWKYWSYPGQQRAVYRAGLRGLWSGNLLFDGLPMYSKKFPHNADSVFRCAPHDVYQIQFFNSKTGEWENGAMKCRVQIITGFE